MRLGRVILGVHELEATLERIDEQHPLYPHCCSQLGSALAPDDGQAAAAYGAEADRSANIQEVRLRGAGVMTTRATDAEVPSGFARSLSLLGDRAFRRQNLGLATRLIGEASEAARELNDSTLEFLADYYRYLIAADAGREGQATALKNSLLRLLHGTPSAMPEVREFLRSRSAKREPPGSAPAE